MVPNCSVYWQLCIWYLKKINLWTCKCKPTLQSPSSPSPPPPPCSLPLSKVSVTLQNNNNKKQTEDEEKKTKQLPQTKMFQRHPTLCLEWLRTSPKNDRSSYFLMTLQSWMKRSIKLVSEVCRMKIYWTDSNWKTSMYCWLLFFSDCGHVKLTGKANEQWYEHDT